ncbi:hypothetical protein HMPREF9098_0488 [Kingella denitrificans ATCC 33394]|uniref:Uncharacterized protein n=1 Tax=Kingella denitrificans ATCC 33394 TaxID=888741 RepID=F0EXB0_9NEIS|nr:hypothetical protein HMPREF9098_0488 [Kingella denitrificans ATCC 33394]
METAGRRKRITPPKKQPAPVLPPIARKHGPTKCRLLLLHLRYNAPVSPTE